MLSLKNVRFEILRDPIVRDFSMDLQPGEVKTFIRPKRLWQDHCAAFNFRFGKRQNRAKSRIHSVKRGFCFKKIVYWKISLPCRISPFLWIILMNMNHCTGRKDRAFFG